MKKTLPATTMLMTGLVCLALAASFSCVSTATAQDKQWFVDQDLVCEQGSALSNEYLKQHAPEFHEQLGNILPWVVRIEVQHTFSKTGYSSNHGTGIILEGGVVLTARHVLEENVNADKLKIVLTLADGRVFRAKVEHRGEKDWSVLKFVDAAEHKDILDSNIVLGTATAAETTVFIAYPARQGLDENGKVQSFNKGNMEKGIAVSRLNPSLVVSSVQNVEAMSLDPLAGFPPVGGMSGGPIFNLKGEVAGVQVSVSRTQDTTGKVLSYRINAVPSTDISISN